MSATAARPDVIQETIRRVAYRTPLTRRGTVLCARWLIYLIYVGSLFVVWRQRRTVTIARVVRAAALVGSAPTIGKVLSQRIDAPRPFVTNGVPPLVQADPDEGFPSTHAVQATALMLAVWELRDEDAPQMAAGAILVMLGRLGANVHYTRDILGGLGLSALLAPLARRLPLPRLCEQSVDAALRRLALGAR